MKGLGDNLFQRPFVRAAAARHAAVYLETPWPELYSDLPRVFPVRTATTLRTQAKNEAATQCRYREPPRVAVKARFGYAGDELKLGNILEALERSVPLNAGDRLALDLPQSCRHPSERIRQAVGERYAILRPATVRTEWSNPARNPRPQYLVQAAEELRAAGVPVVVIADLEPGVEDLVGELPPHDLAFLRGELPLRELLGAVANAAAVAGGVGWLLPAAIAAHVPALVVLGGNGAHNAPEKITDPRLDLSTITFARPDSLCICNGKGHECDKRIGGFRSLARAWARNAASN